MDAERTRRRHLKLEERRQIAERCENSGLSQSEFARRHHLSLSSLQRWLSEARNRPRDASAVVFQEVSVASSLAPPLSPVWAVEIVGPDGITVRCRDRWAVEDLVRLLRGRPC
jgi:transcriptional regulator with XRE-family HTH domain